MPSSHPAASLGELILPGIPSWCPVLSGVPCTEGRPGPQSWILSPLLGSQELPEEEAETDFSSRLPAAHLIGKDLKGSPRMLALLPTVPLLLSLQGSLSDLLHHLWSLKRPPSSPPAFHLLASLLELSKPLLHLPTTPPPGSAPHTLVPSVPSPKSLQRWRVRPRPAPGLGFCWGLTDPTLPPVHPPRSPGPGSFFQNPAPERRQAPFSPQAPGRRGKGWAGRRRKKRRS